MGAPGSIPLLNASCFQKNEVLCRRDNSCQFIDNFCIKRKLYENRLAKPNGNEKNQLYKDRYIRRQNDLKIARYGLNYLKRYVFSNKLNDNTV